MPGACGGWFLDPAAPGAAEMPSALWHKRVRTVHEGGFVSSLLSGGAGISSQVCVAWRVVCNAGYGLGAMCMQLKGP